jgi:membrane-associated phospholipid phosphatase
VHWPSDVLAGLLLGTAVALLGVAIITRFEQTKVKTKATPL